MSRYEAKHELKHTSKHGLNHKSKHVAKHDLKRVPRHKPTIFYVFGVTLLIIAVCGTVLAYMFKSTDDKTNHFTPAVVSCEVKEITDQQVTEKSSIKVKNTGNINAYIRVRFVSYWIRTTDDGQNQIVPMPSEMPEIDINQGWLKGENHTYYCKSPIAPGDLTNELLSSNLTLLEKDGCQQVIEVFAEAIQSTPAKAVSEVWNVVLDQNGNIENLS